MSGPELWSGAGQAGDAGWRRASRCANGECVEVSSTGNVVLIRDSENPSVVLRCSIDSWTALTDAIRSGQFDVLA